MAASRLLLLIGLRRVDIPLARGGWQEMRASPAATFNGKEVIVAQAVLWPDDR
jgi:hypothetical protein